MFSSNSPHGIPKAYFPTKSCDHDIYSAGHFTVDTLPQTNLTLLFTTLSYLVIGTDISALGIYWAIRPLGRFVAQILVLARTLPSHIICPQNDPPPPPAIKERDVVEFFTSHETG